MNKKIIFASIGLVALVAAGFFYWQWKESPTYSLMQLAVGIKEHDRDKVEKYLDVEGVANDFIDQAFSQVQKETQGGAMGNVAQGLMELIKPKISSVLKTKFLNFVESGKFQETTPEDAATPANLSKTLDKAMDKKVAFHGIKSIKKDGKIALVTLDMEGADGQRIYPEVTMRKRDGYWQIASVPNLFSLIKTPEAAVADAQPASTPDPLELLAYPSLEDLIKSKKSEDELRGYEVKAIIKNGERTEFVTATVRRWEAECKSNPGYPCRLFAYIHDLAGDLASSLNLYEQACHSGKDPIACMGVVQNKKVTQASKDSARQMVDKDCTAGNKLSCYYSGMIRLDAGTDAEATSFFDKSCTLGNSDGCFQYGLLLEKDPNKSDAIKTIGQKLSEQGVADGFVLLGDLADSRKDAKEAEALYTKGCDGNSMEACLRLGKTLVDEDKISEAYFPWVKGCNKLDGQNCWMLGVIQKEYKDKQANLFFNRACDLGQPQACKEVHR